MKLGKINDGRYIIAIYLFAYLSLAFILANTLGYTEALRFLDIPPMIPAFADLHVIAGAFETLSIGGDPYIYNEFDPWHRPYNYPRIWLALGYYGLNHENIFFLGSALAILFFIMVFKVYGKISIKEGMYSALVICSPATFLALERGNNDLIIFILLSSIILLYDSNIRKKNIIATFIILLAAVLKLYPAYAISLFLKEKKTIFTTTFTVFVVLFSIYIYITWSDLIYVFNNTPHESIRSYGSAVIPMTALSTFFGSYTEYKPYFPKIGLVTGNFILVVIGLFCISKIRNLKLTIDLNKKNPERKLLAFRIGASIFIGTFALGNNWDYRLIYLILVIPQLLYWYKHIPELKTLFFIALGTALAVIQWNFFSFEWSKRIFLLNEITTWTLMGVLLYLFILSSPVWFRKLIRAV